jgi:AcrR family transcriptional regulator
MTSPAQEPPVGKERLTREARRNLILDAATDVFGRQGFEATRMDDVAKAAGVAKGLVYKHFTSKDALFEALVDRQGRAYAEQLRGALSASDVAGQPYDALRRGLALWLQTVGDDRAAFNVTDPGVHDAYHSLREHMRAVIAESITAAEPRVEPPYDRLLAALIQGAAENLGVVWREHADQIDEQVALEMLARFCWGGLMDLVTLVTGAEPATP